MNPTKIDLELGRGKPQQSGSGVPPLGLLRSTAARRCHFAAIAAFGLTGCGVRSGAPSWPAPAPTQVTRGNPSLSFHAAWSAPDEVRVFMKLRYGVPWVSCRINGRDIWMILDTGSQRTVLEAATARQCGVQTLLPTALKVAIGGANGIETSLAGIPSTMALGEWQWHGAPCLIRTRRTEMGLFARFSLDVLGMDMLQAMCSYVVLDFPRGEAVFGFRRPFQPAPGAVEEPVVFQGTLPAIFLAEGEKRWKALLDTGASGTVQVDRATACELGWWQKSDLSDILIAGLGSQVPGEEAVRTHLSVLHLQGLGGELEKVDVAIGPGQSRIGTGLLKHTKIALDLKRSKLWLE